MPNFDPTQAKLDSIHQAAGLLGQLQSIYSQSKIAQAALLLFQAATDPVFNAEVEAIFSHSADFLRPVWRMFMTTGIRRNELVNMRFDDIDFEQLGAFYDRVVEASKEGN